VFVGLDFLFIIWEKNVKVLRKLIARREAKGGERV